MAAPLQLDMIARIMRDPGAIGLPHDPHARGYVATYGGGETRCPCCGRSNWIVGRLLAECAFCSAAVPLPERGLTLAAEVPIGRRHRHQALEARGGHRRAA